LTFFSIKKGKNFFKLINPASLFNILITEDFIQFTFI
jgi:hypothetical protein